jgi:hypothetical protein
MAFIAQRKEDSIPHIASGAALVTGASSGIGHATARDLAAVGYPTVATARHPDALADLAAASCHTLALDVTDESSMTRAVRAVEEAHGGIAALINSKRCPSPPSAASWGRMSSACCACASWCCRGCADEATGASSTSARWVE